MLLTVIVWCFSLLVLLCLLSSACGCVIGLVCVFYVKMLWGCLVCGWLFADLLVNWLWVSLGWLFGVLVC